MSCITLLSDFGMNDAAVATIKGTLLLYTPQLPMIDLCHTIEQKQMQQAAYILRASYKKFPVKTCHLILFDIFKETEPTMVLCHHDEHYFLAPDNGFLSLTFNGKLKKVKRGIELSRDRNFNYWVHFAANIIKELQTTSFDNLLLPETTLKVAPKKWKPIVDKDSIETHVLHIDHFENVVIDLTKEEFEKIGQGRAFRILFMRNEEITTISQRYNDVKHGQKLARFNSAGYMEIAINGGKAASLFGLKLFHEQTLTYSTFKIFFQ